MIYKKEDFKIGVIGYGFLGSAIVHGFGLHTDIKIYDKFKKGFNTLGETTDHAEFLFFCLPTPMFEDGNQDLSILEEAVSEVHKNIQDDKKRIAIIKSTVLPGTNQKLQDKYAKLTFISNPEHLTARNNKLDFICASRIIIGGEQKWAIERVEALYRHRFGNSMPIYKTSWKSAEMEKYVANCFFAVKVSYFNFIYDLCEKLGLDYEEIKNMVLSDGRIGRSHCDVMSGDGVSEKGKRQYGGACFPKDINALLRFSESLNIDPKLIRASWEQNVEGRPERDWEQISGVMSKRNDKK